MRNMPSLGLFLGLFVRDFEGKLFFENRFLLTLEFMPFIIFFFSWL